MKKRAAGRLRLQTETIRSLDAQLGLVVGGGTFATIKAVCGLPPTSHDGTTILPVIVILPPVSLAPSIICG